MVVIAKLLYSSLLLQAERRRNRMTEIQAAAPSEFDSVFDMLRKGMQVVAARKLH